MFCRWPDMCDKISQLKQTDRAAGYARLRTIVRGLYLFKLTLYFCLFDVCLKITESLLETNF